MNVLVFDTETTSLNKPYCYNIGYVIADITNGTILKKADFVIEQIWHNLPLFSTAYYADKRPIYVNRMKVRKTLMDKFGYVMQTLYRDMKKFDVQFAYAYNAPFDERVCNFNSDYFHTINPFDNIPIIDILPFAQKIIAERKDYQNFCEQYSLFTESGNYSCTAESIYRYLTNNVDFAEEHTALADSIIEYDILNYCYENGIDITQSMQSKISIPRNVEKTLTINNHRDNKTYQLTFTKKRESKKKMQIDLW